MDYGELLTSIPAVPVVVSGMVPHVHMHGFTEPCTRGRETQRVLFVAVLVIPVHMHTTDLFEFSYYLHAQASLPRSSRPDVLKRR